VIPFGAELASDLIDNPEVPGAQIAAVRSVRDDPLAWLFSRAMIDQAQFTAGRHWQRAWEEAGIGLIRAMDPLKGGLGLAPDLITERNRRAFRMLVASRQQLGNEGYLLVVDVLGNGLFVAEVARRRGFASPAALRYFGRRFREYLELLALTWGYASSRKERR
jgi:hypothetical protein